jgi:Double-GTPase 2
VTVPPPGPLPGPPPGPRRSSTRRTAPAADRRAFSSDRTAHGHTVRCYFCHDAFTWPADPQLYRLEGGDYVEIDSLAGLDEVKQRDARLEAWIRCPNPSGDMSEHHLPVSYGGFGPPLVIGLIGASETGKSHLLAAMIHQIERDRLAAVGLTHRPASLQLHRAYVRDNVVPLFGDGKELRNTLPEAADALVSFKEAILVDDGRRTRAVAFFDVSGEDLAQITRSMRFVLAMDALIFVVDPEIATGAGPVEDVPGAGDRAFEAVLRRFAEQRDAFAMPVAVAITKCDRVRFEHPVSRWLRREELAAYRTWGARAGGLDELVKQITDESRDAYAYLYKYEDALPWLRPVEEFRRATLHFVSATGGSSVLVPRADGDPVKVFPRGARPRRVLDPLVAIFAMTGVLGDGVRRIGT